MKNSLANDIIKTTTGVLLLGGQGSRMGYVNKSLLLLKGETFFDISKRALNLFPSTVISTKENSKPADCNNSIIYDIIDAGPLGALYSVFLSTESQYIFALSCDTPRVDNHLIEYIIMHKTPTSLAVIPMVNGQIHPLCGLYSREVFPFFEKAINSNSYSINKALKGIDVKYIELSGSIHENKFLNINSPSDYELLNSNTAE